MAVSRDMFGRIRLRSEHIVLEQRPPGLACRRAAARAGSGWRESGCRTPTRLQSPHPACPPPVVDQQVERLERFDVMPPQRRYEDRIPGLRARQSPRPPAPRETLGKRIKIRRVQRHQAHRRAGRREIERPDVEIRDLLGRKQREAPPTADHAADVVPLVEMRRRSNRVAEPDSRQNRGVERLSGHSPRKIPADSRESARSARPPPAAGQMRNSACTCSAIAVIGSRLRTKLNPLMVVVVEDTSLELPAAS